MLPHEGLNRQNRDIERTGSVEARPISRGLCGTVDTSLNRHLIELAFVHGLEQTNLAGEDSRTKVENLRRRSLRSTAKDLP